MGSKNRCFGMVCTLRTAMIRVCTLRVAIVTGEMSGYIEFTPHGKATGATFRVYDARTAIQLIFYVFM